MLYAPLYFKVYENHALMDIGAVQSAISENEPSKNKTANPEALLNTFQAPEFNIQIANGTTITVRK